MAEPTPAPVAPAPLHPELFSKAPGMQRGCTAKGDHGVFGQVLAVFHRMNPRRIGHVLVDHFGHAKGGFNGVHIQRIAQRGSTSAGLIGMQRDRAAREIVGIKLAQNKIRIGHGRRIPPRP